MADIKRVGIVGSGQMGSGICQIAAQHGFDTVLRSRQLDAAERSKERVAKALAKLVAKERISDSEAEHTMAHVSITDDLNDLADCDLIIESVVEDLPTKKAIFVELSRIVGDDAILATNTSTLSVTEIAVSTERPEAVVGLHFFNPAPLMALVEVVSGLTTSPEVADRAAAFAESCGKSPVRTKDRAGFVVNALLFPYLNNAVRLLETGVASAQDIDDAMKGGCGFPMGPLATLDLVGLDVSVAILEVLHEEYGGAETRPQPLLKRLLAAGRLGRKAGAGFFDYG